MGGMAVRKLPIISFVAENNLYIIYIHMRICLCVRNAYQYYLSCYLPHRITLHVAIAGRTAER